MFDPQGSVDPQGNDMKHSQLSALASKLTCGLILLGAGAFACSGATPPPAEPTPPPSETSEVSSVTTTHPAPETWDASTAPTASDAGAPTADAAPEAEALSAPLELPKGSVVLHIGDSFAGALGVPLNEELRSRGLVSHLRFKTASFIPNWAGGYDLGAYIAQLKPDLVLITLGANEMAMKDPTLRVPLIKKIVKRLNGTPCVWIATPLWGMDNGLMDLIRDNSAPCRFMDTNKIHPGMPRLSDKIHPTIAARKGWAKVVVEWLQNEREPTPAQVWHLKGTPVGAEPEPGAAK
ncbi:MAG: SGNH/GDSL hydrolase family protein [Polyangiaceae bacterium]|nr:SGNH/GDSL hydrolase family protein [Polyangiaceae bacterium]